MICAGCSTTPLCMTQREETKCHAAFTKLLTALYMSKIPSLICLRKAATYTANHL